MTPIARSAQRLGDTVGRDRAHVPMSLATRRQIGGASNLWAGRCVPFDPVDFRDRNLVGSARWPLEYGELERYFSRACEWCMCGEPSFDASRIPTLADAALIPGWPEGDVRSTSLERWSLPTNFGRAYRARLRSSRLVTVVSGLTCTEIICSREGRARSVSGHATHERTVAYRLGPNAMFWPAVGSNRPACCSPQTAVSSVASATIPDTSAAGT